MDWQPIETAPKSYQALLLLNIKECDDDGVHIAAVCVGYWGDLGKEYVAGESGWINWWETGPEDEAWLTFEPTHWMPLPAPPHTKE